MEYLKPVEQLKSRIKFDQGIIFGLLVLLGLLLIAVPQILKGEPYLLKLSDDLPNVVQSEPWRLSESRIEGFSREYLEARFHWSAGTLTQSKARLKAIVGDSIFGKLKDSLSANDALAQNQKAESFYVLERQAYSSAMDRAELRITRVLRIRNIALATPLLIQLSVKQASITKDNPFGLVVSEIDEQEVRDTSGEAPAKR